jgi:LPS export ABC transporter protein LptC
MNTKTAIFTILLLIGFVATSLLALFTAKKITTPQVTSVTTPDFFMSNAIYTKFDKEGNIQNQIQTSKIIHFHTKNTFLFDNPDIIMHTPNENPWHITAAKGKSIRGKNEIWLWGDVKIAKEAGKNNLDFDIRTKSLTVYPENKFAKTDKPLKVIQGENMTKAVGGEVDLKSGTVKLLSHIESIFK